MRIFSIINITSQNIVKKEHEMLLRLVVNYLRQCKQNSLRRKAGKYTN